MATQDTLFDLLLKELDELETARTATDAAIADSTAVLALTMASLDQAKSQLTTLKGEIGDIVNTMAVVKKENADLKIKVSNAKIAITGFSDKLKALTLSKDIVLTAKAVAELAIFDKTAF